MRALWFVPIFMLAGCAGTPPAMDPGGVTSTIRPDADASVVKQNLGKTVRWGGQIVAIANNEQSTQVQVLSYPLSKTGRPNPDAGSSGRFILAYDGFLEPYDYAPGKLISAIGAITGVSEETVGESRVDIPSIDAEKIHLWRPADSRVFPFFSIGVGIGL